MADDDRDRTGRVTSPAGAVVWRCAWCGSASHDGALTGHERQHAGLGAGEQGYLRCASCGALTADAPYAGDLATHYPGDYYAYAPLVDGALTARVRGARAAGVVLQRRTLASRVVTRLSGVPDDLRAAGQVITGRDCAVLDIGSGRGRLLTDLHHAGCRRLLGWDPFGPEQLQPVRLTRTWPAGHLFDVIMLHHSIEHSDAPLATLERALTLLAPDGRLLVRAPVIDSEAADEYGTDWVQLDAPRHRAIPSREGMHRLAARLGLHVERSWDDSTAFQFWGSEGYRRGLCLESFSAAPQRLFPRASLRAWAARAAALNRAGRGDQACWILKRAG